MDAKFKALSHAEAMRCICLTQKTFAVVIEFIMLFSGESGDVEWRHF